MKMLNSHHLSALLNISKDVALAKIAKIRGQKLSLERDFALEKDFKAYKKNLYSELYANQEELKDSGIADYDVIIDNIHKTYHKTPSCVSYCMDYVHKQLQPQKDGKIKQSVNIPREVLYFISMEQREFFRGLINKRYAACY